METGRGDKRSDETSIGNRQRDLMGRAGLGRISRGKPYHEQGLVNLASDLERRETSAGAVRQRMAWSASPVNIQPSCPDRW